MDRLVDKIKANPKKSALAGVGILGALFTMLEQTGWALLSPAQHKAILGFFQAVVPFL